MLKIETNRNTILFSLLIYKILYENYLEKVPHRLATKVFNDFDKLQEQTVGKYFLQQYKGEHPLKINYQYNVLTTFIDENLELSDHTDQVKHIKQKDLQKHKEVIQRIKEEFLEEFNQYYEEEIASEWEQININIAEALKEYADIQKILDDFWKIDFKPTLILIPNPLSTGDCFGVSNNKKFYSISAPRLDKETEQREFNTKHIISNMVHEFSHSYMDQSIEELDLLHLEENISSRKIQKLKQQYPEMETLQTYGSAYFLECFDRAATLYLREKVGLFTVDEQILSKENELGFLFTQLFYEGIRKGGGKKPVEKYIQTIETLV